MKKFVMLSLIILNTGCSTIDPAFVETIFPNPHRYGYNPGDPCIRCGENYIFIPHGKTVAETRQETPESN